MAASTAYSADRQKSAANKAMRQQEEQYRMTSEAEKIRLAQEEQLAQQALAAQRSAQAAQQRAFNQQQAAARRAAEEARQAEIRRQTNIQQGQGLISEMFGQFNDDFYNSRKQSYIDYATPQLERQYQDAMNSLVRSLSRSGNLNSSVRAQSMADLERQRQEALAQIASQGAQYANQARSSIEASRADLMKQNASLADPGTMRGLIQSSVSSLSQAPTYTPIGTLINALISNSGEVAGVNKRAEETQGVGLLSNALTTGTGTTVQ